jgi:transcriptional regulator with XRE-family HTH domain
LADRESFGQRLARHRKERGFTQVELAEKSGLIQNLISDYERDKLRPHADIIVRFARALEVSADELLGLRPPKKQLASGNRRFLRRLQQVDKLPKRDQDALLRTIDAFLAARKTG